MEDKKITSINGVEIPHDEDAVCETAEELTCGRGDDYDEQ